MRVLVTGANGFVGRHVCRALADAGCVVRAAVRADGAAPEAAESVTVGALGPGADWRAAVADVAAIVHCAARVHVMQDGPDGAALYRAANVDGTRVLAEQGAAAGVRRFVFVSTAKVLGERTTGRPFRNADPPDPADPYAVSKRDAEDALRDVAVRSGIEVAVVRPPLVYGPGVGANFARLLDWVARGVPLPLGSLRNARSLVAVQNLAGLVSHLVAMPRVPDEPLLVSDGEDLSTPELVRRLARQLGVRPRLLPVPVGLLRAGLGALGRSAEFERLAGSLQLHLGDTIAATGWRPALPVDDALRATVEWYRARRVP